MAELLALSDQTDENGRLLLEDSAPRKARKRAEKAGVAMRTTRCTYADSPLRVGGLMNASAYDALRHDTAEMLNGFAWLAGGYLAIHPAHKGTTRGLFDVANMGVTLPLVLFHRAEGAIAHHGQLPSWVGSLFKASRGVFSATVDLGNRSGPGAALTAAETVAFAEEAGHLRRPETARVCAAPTRLIERTIAVMLTGEGADPSRSHLGQWLDFALLWRFYS
ncbi:MAG: hypothetical protein ACRD0F_01805, partial [Acidimicrobiales bacterium]